MKIVMEISIVRILNRKEYIHKKISYLLIFSLEKICEFMSKNYEIIFG